ncbi:MAG TPA: FHA domain-containing protein, partial [Thermoanaerobaculia bacterium]|nr:FHA domain-containing protein [Thermoanaerobaculia bacterium]
MLEVVQGQRRRRVPLGEGTVVLGRAADCHVVLQGDEVAPRHAALELHEERALLSTLTADGGVRVNGVLLREGALRSGDSLQIGAARLGLRRVAPPRRERRRTNEGELQRAATVRSPPAAVLEQLYDWSRVGPPERSSEMLAVLAAEWGASDAALVLWRDGEPTVLAACGGAPDALVARAWLPAWAADHADREAAANVSDAAAAGPLAVAVPLRGEQWLGLTLDLAADAATAALARLAVRFFA